MLIATHYLFSTSSHNYALILGNNASVEKKNKQKYYINSCIVKCDIPYEQRMRCTSTLLIEAGGYPFRLPQASGLAIHPYEGGMVAFKKAKFLTTRTKGFLLRVQCTSIKSV